MDARILCDAIKRLSTPLLETAMSAVTVGPGAIVAQTGSLLATCGTELMPGGQPQFAPALKSVRSIAVAAGSVEIQFIGLATTSDAEMLATGLSDGSAAAQFVLAYLDDQLRSAIVNDSDAPQQLKERARLGPMGTQVLLSRPAPTWRMFRLGPIDVPKLQDTTYGSIFRVRGSVSYDVGRHMALAQLRTIAYLRDDVLGDCHSSMMLWFIEYTKGCDLVEVFHRDGLNTEADAKRWSNAIIDLWQDTYKPLNVCSDGTKLKSRIQSAKFFLFVCWDARLFEESNGIINKSLEKTFDNDALQVSSCIFRDLHTEKGSVTNLMK